MFHFFLLHPVYIFNTCVMCFICTLYNHRILKVLPIKKLLTVGLEALVVWSEEVVCLRVTTSCHNWYPPAAANKDGRYMPWLANQNMDRCFVVIGIVRDIPTVLCSTTKNRCICPPYLLANSDGQYGIHSRRIFYIHPWSLWSSCLMRWSVWSEGGYSVTNTARCWSLLTATALNTQLPADIPDHEVVTSSAMWLQAHTFCFWCH